MFPCLGHYIGLRGPQVLVKNLPARSPGVVSYRRGAIAGGRRFIAGDWENAQEVSQILQVEGSDRIWRGEISGGGNDRR